jgi:polysaccharide biosynthesis/export protein
MMRAMTDRTRAAFLAVLAALLMGEPARAQLPGGITPEQIQMFQNLPKDQRDAILQQFGLGGLAGAAGSGASESTISVMTPTGAKDAETEDNRPAADKGRIVGGESLLIDLSAQPPAPGAAAPPRSPSESEKISDLRTRILRHNPYELDRDGVLRLPGFAPIPLAGLSADEVHQRLALDPTMRDFTVSVTVLHLRPIGLEGLRPFGYSIFRGTANAFVPGTDIPVPADYKVGPGDVLQVQLYGQKVQSYSLPVNREGSINIPNLGPLMVGGMSFGGLRSLIEQRVQKRFMGTQARVDLSELRSVRVLVLGDAEKPGSYVVSGLATVTSALFASGGVKPIGSLRNIEVRRAGQLLRRLDLYDVLLHGNTADDVHLETGDVVFIPPVGPTVGIAGEVRRPAIYELVKERSAGEAIAIAGGLNPEADSRSVRINRIGANHQRSVVTVDLSLPSGAALAVQTGDVLEVATIRPVIGNGIQLEGHVLRPGSYEYREGLRLSDILHGLDDLKPRADVHYLLIRREDPQTRRITVLSADLYAAIASPGSGADLPLAARDRLTVFDLESNRDRVVEPLLDELRRQSDPARLAPVTQVGGSVNVPGSYPLEEGMRVGDLLRAGGGLSDAAYANGAELVRYSIVERGERRVSELRRVDLAAVVRGDPTENFLLQPYDLLTIKEMPEWRRIESIEVTGEVRFPGTYLVRRGETLRSVLERAGGLTSLAFAEGAVFTRQELREKEREEIDRLATRLKADIATYSLQSAQSAFGGGAQAVTVGQSLIDQLGQAKPVGRLVIDLPAIVAQAVGARGDITLRNGDKLSIPRVTQEVSVLGEVQSPTSHLYRAGLGRDDYVSLSGGTTPHADRKNIYVVRADGSVVGTGAGWLHPSAPDIRPGDTVVVPLDAGKMRPLPLWTAVTTIIYNLAVATAAIARL